MTPLNEHYLHILFETLHFTCHFCIRIQHLGNILSVTS